MPQGTTSGPDELSFAIKNDGSATTIVNADGATFTEILRVTVPYNPTAVWLEGVAIVQATAAGTQANVVAALMPAGGNLFNILDAQAGLLVGGPSSTNAEPEGRKLTLARRLDPASPGDYVLAVVRKSGSAAAVVLGTSLITSWLRARRA